MKFFTSTTQAVLLNFTGTTDANFACNGPTDLGVLRVDKGIDSQVLLNVTSSNDVLGTFFGNLRLTSTVAGDILVLRNGITKLGNNIYLDHIHNGKPAPANLADASGWYQLGTSTNSPTLWVAGATVVNDNTASLFVIYGILRISSGQLSSDNNDGGMVIREDAQLLIEGTGSKLIVNKFRPSSTATTHRGSFTMTGGLMQVTGKVLASSFDDQFARFAIPYTTQAFRMSGGTIELYNPNGSGDGFFHVGVNVNNASITGGTIKLFLPNSTNNGTILSTAPLWNLSITKPTAGGTSKALLSAMTLAFTGGTTTIQPLTVLNNFNIDGANPVTFDAAGQDITIQGTLTVGANGTYLPGANTTIFSGLKDQQLVNNGVIGLTAGRATFNNWTIDKAAGTLTLGGTIPSYYVPATAKLNILNGVLNDGGLVINVLGDMYNSASHTGTGSITMAGSALQTIGGDGSGVFGNLTIDNTMGSGTAAAGVVAVKLAANISVASTLNMNSLHIFSIGAYRLSLTNVVPSDALTGPGGGSFGTQRFIQTAGNQSDLGLQRTYGSNSSPIFPVGTGTKYTPATISLNSPTNNGKYGQVSVSPTDKRNPFLSGSNNAFNYYWKVRSTGFTPGSIPTNGITATFTARLSDALNTTNGTTTGYVPGFYTPNTTSWKATGTTSLVTSSSPTADIAFKTGAVLSLFDGEYTAGVAAAFGPVTVYYSRGSGDWETPGTWSTDPVAKFTGAAATVKPGPGNPVVIGLAGTYNHVVTVKQEAATAGSLIIDTGSTLDVGATGATTGHNFGALPDGKASGLGLLRITSTTALPIFPGGDFGSFLLPGGGTVEYYTNGTNFTLPTVSGTLSLVSYCNLLLSPANGALITLPNVDLRIFDSMTSGISTGTTGITSLNGAAARALRIDNLLAVKYGTLRFANGSAQTLQLNKDMQVDAGATFDASGTGGATTANAITITGSVTNNGTVNFGQTSKVNLTFTGTTTSNITGTNAGANTTLYTLTLNKGIGRTALLNLDVAGTLTTPTSGWLTLNNGTLRYAKATGTLTIHDAATTYLITDNAGLTVDAATATVTIATANNAASDLKLAGEINVLQGTLNVGNPAIAAGNDLEYASAGAPTLRVGNNNPTSTATLNVNGQIRRTINNLDGSLRYDQSGGITDIKGLGATATYNNERGLFEVQGVGSIFRMSDGFLNLHRSNQKSPITTADLYLAPDSTVVTGGTVVLGNTAATVGSVVITVNSAVPLYNLIVEGVASGTNTNTGKQAGTGALSLKGSLTLRNVSSFFNANGLPLNIDQDLTNNNTLANASLTTGGFQPGVATQTTTFTGKGPVLQQLMSVAGNLTVFGGLVVNNAQTGGTLQLGGNAQVFGTLALTKGTLDDNGKTITALGDVLNSAKHISSGSGSLTLGGSVNQNIGGSGLGKFGNLTLNNAAGATSTANQEITNVLTLSNGVFFIGSNLLWLNNTAAGAVTGTFSTTRCIRTNGIVADLGVRKSFPSGASSAFTFPIGAAVVTKYTPVQMTVTASSSAGSITVQPIDLAHPSTTNPAAKELSYYWKVGSTGLASPTVTQVFTYYDINSTNTDVNGNESLYKLGRFLSGAWVPAAVAGVGGIATSVVNTGANTLTNAGATYIDGDYTGGEPSEFGAVPTFYSRNSTAGTAGGANWTDPLAWTSNADGSNPSIVPTATPTLANPVVILPSHLIVSNSAGIGAATLKLDGTLDLGSNLANNFNTVGGTGTLRIGSAIFPAGNYASFVAANTGTVEFTGAVQLPARDTYNNLTLSGGNAKQLTNLDLTINGLLSIAASTTVDNSTNQSIVLTSGTSGASLNGTLNLSDGTLATGASLATGSTGRLNLGAGAVAIGTSLANAGTLNMGNGAVTVGTSLTNTGTYKANAGTGSVTVGTTFSNSGTYTGGIGSLNVASDFTNSGTLTTNSGTVNARSTFSNSGTYTATTSNVMHVDGNYTNLSNGSFNAASSNMVLRADFTNRGTFTAGSSLVQFITDANHLINGGTTFYDLQKLGNNSLVLGTATDVRVGNLLTMQNGVINTGTNTGNILFLDNQGFQPIVGNTLTSYVAGRLAITLPNEVGNVRIFPVGAGQRYRPVSISQLGSGSVNPVVLVEIINGKPLGGRDAILTNLSANRYYRIQLQGKGTIDQPIVQLSFNTDVVDEEVNVPGNLRVAYTSSTAIPAASNTWISTGGSGVFSPDSPRGYTTSGQGTTTIDASSFFALGSTNSVDNPLTGVAPLPVELVQFSAVRQGTAVQVAWATASEKNSDYFAVERSANGQFFNEIGRVNAHGSTTLRHEYGTLDKAPLAGLSYYRLRQVDLDGKFAYSPVATVRFDDKAAAPTLLAYPNPATGTGFQLAATNLGGTGGTVRLYDGVGRVIFTQAVAPGTAETTIQPTRALASGMYIATWTTPEGLKLTTKVAVE